MHKFGRETPNSIWLWNQETFSNPPRNLAFRANLEIAELVTAVLFNYSLDKIHEELADCCIMLWAISASAVWFARPEIIMKQEAPEITVTKLNTKYAHFIQNLAKRNTFGYKEVRDPFLLALKQLEQLIHHYGVDIAALVDNKMTINRNRVWKNLENGNFQHVA